jgi:hypothetical protein
MLVTFIVAVTPQLVRLCQLEHLELPLVGEKERSVTYTSDSQIRNVMARLSHLLQL